MAHRAFVDVLRQRPELAGNADLMKQCAPHQ
jgi:hypothetical protein